MLIQLIINTQLACPISILLDIWCLRGKTSNRKISRLEDAKFDVKLFYRLQIWQSIRQPRCWDASQISLQLEIFKPCGNATSRLLVELCEYKTNE